MDVYYGEGPLVGGILGENGQKRKALLEENPL